MFKIVLLLSAVVLSAANAQLIAVQPVVRNSSRTLLARSSNWKNFHSQAHYVQPGLAHPELAHSAVLQSGAWESQLPPHLQKSAKFYGNPRTAAHLAEESWFTNEENPVFARKAEEIDRSQITKIFRNSGLQKRK